MQIIDTCHRTFNDVVQDRDQAKVQLETKDALVQILQGYLNKNGYDPDKVFIAPEQFESTTENDVNEGLQRYIDLGYKILHYPSVDCDNNPCTIHQPIAIDGITDMRDVHGPDTPIDFPLLPAGPPLQEPS